MEFVVTFFILSSCKLLSGCMLLAYADYIDIIGSHPRYVSSAFAAIEKQSNKVGLQINDAKTKYFLSTRSDSQRLDQQVTVNNHNFERVEDVVYLGTSVNKNNKITWEIKRRITLANRCYFGLELLELKCFNETKCKQFEYDGVQSNCIQEHCQCHTEEGERVNCNPLSHKVNNIIGGPCPCQQPNTECDMQQEVCYCVRNYMPSNDRRRCIKKIATLEEKCELDLQCQRADYNAVCNADRKICLCMDHYINDEGKCASIVGLKSICSTDAQCIRNYDINSKCTNTTQHCVCEEGYLTSVDNSRCLKISKYLGKCIENIQCLGSMGLGGKCINNTCQCSEKYYVEEKKSANKKLETVCTAVIERGHSCRYEGDCYQRQLNESEQSMNCIFGECNCRLGFYSYNDGECLRESSGSGGIKPSINYNLIVYTICFVNIINFLK